MEVPAPRLNDRMNQLTECVRDFCRKSYSHKWRILDGDLREIEEHIAGVLIYDYVGEEEGHEKQQRENTMTSEEFADFGIHLMQCAVDVATTKGIDVRAIEKLRDDLSNHNPNSHGGDILSADRERIGREAVTNGLDAVLNLLEDTAINASVSMNVKSGFAKICRRLRHAQGLLKEVNGNPEDHKKVADVIEDLFNGDKLLPSPADFDYVLLLPEKYDSEFIELLQKIVALMRWTIIVDPNHENDEPFTTCDALSFADIANTSITPQLSEVKTNWIFLNGRLKETTQKEQRRFFNILRQHILQMKNIIVLDLTYDKELADRALSKIWTLFNSGPESEPSDNTTIISTKGTDTRGNLKDKLERSGYDPTLTEIEISSTGFLSTILYDRMLPSEMLSRLTQGDIQYLEAGIKFLNTEQGESSTIWDSFYSGRTLSLEDLENHNDVYPRGNADTLNKFCTAIKEALSVPDGQVFNLYHQPGAGGTSLVRRIAFDFSEKNQNPEVLPIFISGYDPIKTVEMIAQISEIVGSRTSLLVVVDDKEINETDFYNISRNLKKKGVRCVLIRVLHTIAKPLELSSENSFFLESKLRSNKEVQRFDVKFKNAYSRHLPASSINSSLDNIHSVYEEYKSVEMIYYPYTFSEQLHNTNPDVNFLFPDSFVSYWFNSIKSEELKSICGYIALAYYFSSSKAVELYSLSSVWKKDGIATLKNYPADEIDAFNKLLKISDEEFLGIGVSTLYAPRYAAFAEKILDAWKAGWSKRLSTISVEFINTLPLELTEDLHRLLMDLFIQQRSAGIRGEDDSRRLLSSRFSPLIGQILDSEEGLDGAKTVFKTLIDKYRNDPFYQIHYARLIFEYAHSVQAAPDDLNYKEADKIICKVLNEIDSIDSFHHIAGMYWRRQAKAFATLRSSDVISEVEAIDSIIDATDKALQYFAKCTELNRGTSSYGFVSTAELLISSLSDIRKLKSPTDNEWLNSEPFLGYMDLLNDNIQCLSRPCFANEIFIEEKTDWLRYKYLELFGNIDQAIKDSKYHFESTTNTLNKVKFGRRYISLILENVRKQEKSRYDLYTNLENSLHAELLTTLRILADSGDIRSSEQYFHLCRYTLHEDLLSGNTFNALKRWETLAIEKNNFEQQLMSSFYLSVCYAVKILNLKDERNQQFEQEHYKYRDKCRQLVVNLNEDPYHQIAFVAKDNINTWDCILDPSEAYSINNRQRVYSPRCRRENAIIVDLDGSQGDCEIFYLKKISFSRKGIHAGAKGRKLKDGVIGFRFRGLGLYDFIPPQEQQTIPSSVANSKPHKNVAENNSNNNTTIAAPMTPEKSNSEKTADEPEIFRTESETNKLKGPKILGKINLDALKK